MKEYFNQELVDLAKSKGFESREGLFKVYKSHGYLWMCELLQWLINDSIYISIYFEQNKCCWRVNVEDSEYWNYENSYEEALESGLKYTLKELIK